MDDSDADKISINCSYRVFSMISREEFLSKYTRHLNESYNYYRGNEQIKNMLQNEIPWRGYMSKSKEFSKAVIDELGYYVYIYSDPDTRIPFYIGKGKGNRVFNHLYLDNDSEKVKKIHEIKADGKEPIIEILVHGVDEDTALKVEAAAIDLIGIENLTNIQKGHHSSVYGRIDVDELNYRYNQKVLSIDDINENVIMIRINQHYHYGMDGVELYDVTRGTWRVNFEQVNKVKYAFSVYDGMVLEVYQIAAWLPAFSTLSGINVSKEIREECVGRYEFVGRIADSQIRNKYVGCIVSGLFPKGNQNPIKYFIKE